MAAAVGGLIQEIGKAVKAVAKGKGSSNWWYTPHMSAASHAIVDRIPLIDLVLQVRDARSDKGKLKHSVVSPQPGEIKGISSLKIASHPNIYVLDTPGVLPPNVPDDGVCSKACFNGRNDDVVGEIELARYFLSGLNSSDEFNNGESYLALELETKDGRGNIRLITLRILLSTMSEEQFLMQFHHLIEREFEVLAKAFYLTSEAKESNYGKVTTKLLNLYRTGRLFHNSLDSVPSS